MNSVGDIGGNIGGGELGTIVGGALFLKRFPKTGRNRILFKAKKRIQVSGHIHFEHIFFLEYPLDI